MLKPDAVRQNLTRAIVLWLKAHHLDPVHFVERRLQPSEREAIYRDSPGALIDWDLNGVLYELGPIQALTLAATGSAAAHSDPCAYLAELKGSFIPTLATKGTLRADCGALNPYFSLVHVPDTSDRALMDAELLLRLGGTSLDSLDTAMRRPEHRFDLKATFSEVARVISEPDRRAEAKRWSADLTHAADIWSALHDDPPAVATLWRTDLRWSVWQRDLVLESDRVRWAAYLAYTTLRSADLCARGLP